VSAGVHRCWWRLLLTWLLGSSLPSLEPPVVDELQPLVMRSCGLAPETDVTCLFALSSSHRFTRHLALMCPRCALTLRSVASSSRTFGTVLLTVKRCSLARMRRSAQDSRSVCGLLYLAAVWDDWREEEDRQGMVDTDPYYMDQGPANR